MKGKPAAEMIQNQAPGELPSFDAIGAAYAAVAKHKEALAVPPSTLSRHSPEGFEEVLKTASEGGFPMPDVRSRAKKAADLLTAWADGASLQHRLRAVTEDWIDFKCGIGVIPDVTNQSIEWRIKRTPRKVWVAFHESGSVRDVRATAQHIDIPGQPLAEDYIEFEEKLS